MEEIFLLITLFLLLCIIVRKPRRKPVKVWNPNKIDENRCKLSKIRGRVKNRRKKYE